MTRARRARVHGFSLLELMVAMVIMALSLTMLHQVDAGVLRGLGDQAAQERATVLAQSLLDAREAVPALGWNEQGEAAGFRWTVGSTLLPLPAGLPLTTPPLHEVRIAVYWQGRLGERELQLATLLPQAVPMPGERAP